MGFVGAGFGLGVDLSRSLGTGKGGVQLGPVVRGGLPSGRALEAFAEETIHEARHRQATTFGLVEERGDEGTRDDRLVAGSLCHQGFMPRGEGRLQVGGPFASRLHPGS